MRVHCSCTCISVPLYRKRARGKGKKEKKKGGGNAVASRVLSRRGILGPAQAACTHKIDMTAKAAFNRSRAAACHRSSESSPCDVCRLGKRAVRLGYPCRLTTRHAVICLAACEPVSGSPLDRGLAGPERNPGRSRFPKYMKNDRPPRDSNLRVVAARRHSAPVLVHCCVSCVEGASGRNSAARMASHGAVIVLSGTLQPR